MVNGLGSTPKEELYIMYKEADAYLKEKGINVYHTFIGEMATSMEMAGGSISLLKLDDELKSLVSKPCYTPFYCQKEL